MFYSKLVYTVSSIDTHCIDSNLESGRYISRVGRASRFLSLRTVPTVLRYRYLVSAAHSEPDCHVISMQARGRRGLEEGIHARNRRRVEKSGILGLLPSTNPKLDLAFYSREKVMLREREQAYFRAMLLREPGPRPRGVSRSPYQAPPATRGRRRRKGTPSAAAPVPAPAVQLKRRPRTAEPTKSRPARACLPPPVPLRRRPRTAERTKSRAAQAC